MKKAESYYFRDGLRCVIPNYKVLQTDVKGRWVGQTLKQLFTTEFKHISVEEAKRQIEGGIMYIKRKDGTVVKSLDVTIEEHDILVSRIHAHEPPVPDHHIDIIEDTDEYLVINKPAGIPVHPTGRYMYNSIITILKEEGKYNDLKLVYRLDKNTSGVLVLAKTKRIAQKFQKALRDKTVGDFQEIEKIYLARVVGEFPETLVVDKPIHLVVFGTEQQHHVSDEGISAKSGFKRIFYDKASDTSVVECVPYTGRTHQLRLHLKSVGHPIANDSAYLLEHIHNTRTRDGDTEQELAMRTKYGWVFDEFCEDCNCPKGDPLEHLIWLHAWKYSIEGKTWVANVPEWAKSTYDAKGGLEKWHKIIE
ncbi:ribosomal large subunit pseudouridine synthase C, putative [Entamoeba invadens IP1]|uniref:ribosomal large subunit pseudouridine synthase C, putative n=1 Tax=Entamoeba invadens IP1 TaxID=370355 RepID=UPI0002C3DFF8|nr:ribosomal large subunit pseudouridine synthase C, putative [Entamoeba invadens IP1]ELP90812.1 ribosomal large subunit pseudouridine synthase C, putative [Entamoeba invadens IP1]|eukprot:XP_004257583.1 ribosomal large subunit pseudouridine synthase C, putative [Entamoeba invadens IP1]